MSANSDDELERKLREKWLAGAKPKSSTVSMTEEERRVAEKLLGRANTERLQKHKGVGRFRPAPIIVRYEWWRVRGDHTALDRYHIARIENGYSTDYWQGTDRNELDREIAALRAKEDCQVSEFRLSLEPVDNGHKERNTNCARGQIMATLGTFKVGGQS